MNLAIYISLILVLLIMIPAAEAKGTGRNLAPLSCLQNAGTDSIAWKGKNGKVSLRSFGKCVIYEKDGSQIRNLVLREIHDHWVVYEKDGSLHDMVIDSIDRIQLGPAGKNYLYFDEYQRPYVMNY